MKPYRAAIIGLGRMGSTIDDEVTDVERPFSIASSCHANERLELVAGADLLPERRAAFRERWGVEALYEDYMEMIDQERPDLVAVCTTATGLQKPGDRAPSPDFRGDSHAEIAVDAANAGVPMLFVEKAMACSVRAADEVLAACTEHGTLFNTGVMRRFNPLYHELRAMIERGDIGKPMAAVHHARTTLMHGHIHAIDTLSYLLGDPAIESVRGELQPRDLQIENDRLDEDPFATFEVAFSGGAVGLAVPAGNWEYEVLGSEGSVRSLNNGRGMIRRRASGQPFTWDHMPVPDADPSGWGFNILKDLVDAYESGRPSLGNVEVTHHITEACIAIAESHRRGGTWVSLPLESRDLYVFHV